MKIFLISLILLSVAACKPPPEKYVCVKTETFDYYTIYYDLIHGYKQRIEKGIRCLEYKDIRDEPKPDKVYQN